MKSLICFPLLLIHLFAPLRAESDGHAELPHWPMGWQLPPPLGPETRKRAEEAAASGDAARPLLFRASSLPPEQRAGIFRVPDRDLAEAWIKLHALHGTGNRFAPEE